jgi:hypothetical protein
MKHYATRKRPRRLCWASRLPAANERLESSVERVRGDFFQAQVLILLPGGETLAAEVTEHGRRLQVRGRGRPVTVSARVLWDLVEAMRKADRASSAAD